jgi:hypothetical protein
MLSIDTRPSTTGYDPTDGGLTTPAFRRELEDIAPHLVDKLYSINDTKNEKIEEYGRRYHQAKAACSVFVGWKRETWELHRQG